jgi:hypothetical protein
MILHGLASRFSDAADHLRLLTGFRCICICKIDAHRAPILNALSFLQTLRNDADNRNR